MPRASGDQSPPAPQAKDDVELLDLMLADMKKAPTVYQPTNYWSAYEARSIEEIKARGLTDFRRQSDAVFRSYGAVDFVRPISSVRISQSRLLSLPTRMVPGMRSLAGRMDGFLNRYVQNIDGGDWESYVKSGYHFAASYAQGTYAKPVSSFSVSRVGNPPGLVSIDGRLYSRQHLQYYLQYAFVARHLDFDRIETVAEIGSGMGRQTEIIAQLHPNLAHLLFDIPPQLYVAEQYLSAVFPGHVVSYRTTRDWKDLSGIRPGMIHIFGSWQVPMLSSRKTDLFWNSASFHEMEPDVVRNYLSFVDRSSDWAYLSENLAGGVKAKKPGDYGILETTTFEHYCSSLPSFELVERAPALRINTKTLKDTQMLFRRRGSPG